MWLVHMCEQYLDRPSCFQISIGITFGPNHVVHSMRMCGGALNSIVIRRDTRISMYCDTSSAQIVMIPKGPSIWSI